MIGIILGIEITAPVLETEVPGLIPRPYLSRKSGCNLSMRFSIVPAIQGYLLRGYEC